MSPDEKARAHRRRPTRLGFLLLGIGALTACLGSFDPLRNVDTEPGVEAEGEQEPSPWEPPPEETDPEPELPLPDAGEESSEPPEEPVDAEDAGVVIEPDGGVLVVPNARRLSRPTLRVMTYNIYGGRKQGLSAIARVIKNEKPDLVAMQEVHFKKPGTGNVDQAKRLGELTGMHHAFAHAEPDVGNALLSRFPIQNDRRVALPSQFGAFQRALLYAEVTVDGEKLKVGAVHLAHDSHIDRMNQSREVFKHLNGNGLQLCMGDLNARQGKSPEVIAAWTNHFLDAWERGGVGDGRTAGATSPAVRIDYIMLGQGYRVPTRTWVPVAPTQSDHRPVVSSVVKPWSQSLFGEEAPANPSVADDRPVEVGLKVRFAQAGYVDGVRLYRGATNPAGYRVSLWNANGKLIYTAKVQDGAAPGWIEAGFRSPVKVKADTVYVVSYFSSNGRHARTPGAHTDVLRRGDVVAPAAASVGGNGVRTFAPDSSFPATPAGEDTNFGVDVRFRPETP